MIQLLTRRAIVDRIEVLSFADLVALADHTKDARNDAEYVVAASEWFSKPRVQTVDEAPRSPRPRRGGRNAC